MRYALATLFILFLLVVGIVLVAGRDGGTQSGGNTAKVTKLSDYADKKNAVVSWTMQGQLVGDDQFRSIRITVSDEQRILEIFSGYNNKVIKRKTFHNTAKGFELFMHALDTVSFGRERSSKQPDERGVCPLGNRHIYTLRDDGNQVFRTWSDSCLISDGTFGGNVLTAQRIFRAQITDYSRLVSGTRL